MSLHKTNETINQDYLRLSEAMKNQNSANGIPRNLS